MSSSICCLAARRCSCSTLVPCSLFSQASFCSLLYHNSSCYLSLDRQGRFLPDTLITRLTLRQLGKIALQDQTFFGESCYVEMIGTSFEKGPQVDEMVHDPMAGFLLCLQGAKCATLTSGAK